MTSKIAGHVFESAHNDEHPRGGLRHLAFGRAKDGCLLPLRSSCGAQQETFGGLGWSK